MSFLTRKIHLFKARKKLIIIISIFLFLALSFSSSFLYISHQKPPEIADLATIEFYNSEGKKFFELNNNQDQTYVKLEKISPNMINAIINVEDQNFYQHSGFDYKRIIKSLIDNISSMSKRFGASTITQQYARNLYLNHEKSYIRKLKEAYYTVLLENNYTKEEILEGYLNTIYFGHGVYGVADASSFYFNKPISDITIAEAAILSSIPKAPTYYSPIANYERNKERKELVLSILLKKGIINEQEYNEAIIEDVKLIGKHPRSEKNMAPYFQDILLSELEKFDLNREEFFKGIKVYTTLDTKLNEIIMDKIQQVYSPYSDVETAVYAIDPNTGYVKAVVGGRNYHTSQYNRALSGQRHPGSTIKPLLYYKALEYGFTPTTTFRSAKTTFYVNNGIERYSPSNFADLYADRDITMAYAIAVSDNIYAVKTHLFLGENTLVKTAKRFGITANMLPVPSLALGSTEVKLSEMTAAYGYFANLGRKVTPVYITKITDLNDNIIYEYKPKKQQVLDPDLCFIMNEMLNGIFDTKMNYHTSVTGLSIASRLTHKYAGKSGSTDYDNTMIGFTPDLVLGVWTGYDDQIPLIEYQEKTASKRLWAEVMETYFEGIETPWYNPTKNVKGVLVDPITGIAAYPNNTYTKIMYYLKGTEPDYQY